MIARFIADQGLDALLALRGYVPFYPLLEHILFRASAPFNSVRQLPVAR